MADLTGMLMAASGSGGGQPDPFFNQTVLLLHGDGTNGAQNNTFLDSSTNTFTITRNGNTTQGTFSPFSLAEGEWSNYFDGTGDYLSLASNADLTPASGDFCVECWIYPIAFGTYNGIFVGNAVGGFFFGKLTGGIGLRISATSDVISATAPSTNQWTHVAITRSGTDVRLFYDGVQQGSTVTNSTNFVQSATYIGTDGSGGSYWNGYISGLRFVKGSAVYTSNFTPSTTPLTAITNTELLTCQSNRFVDNSTNNFAITPAGNVAVQPFSPFAPSAAYDASVNGGSAYLDGSGDYLTAADSASWAFGAGNFTVEGWVYRTVGSASQFLFIQSDNSTAPGTSFFVEINSSNKLNSSVYYNSSSSINITSTANVPVKAWTHFAFVRTSGTISQYINGVRDGTDGTLSTNSLNDPAQALGIAARNNGNNPVTGYFSSARIIKGTGPYDATSSTLTIPTAPLTAVSGTELLLNFTNAGIFDNTGKNNLETGNNAQVDTTTKKYGTGSLEFDGTGDYLSIPNNELLDFGTGDYTIEFWIYRNNTTDDMAIIDGRPSGATTGWLVYFGGGNKIKWYVGSDIITGSTTIGSGSWYHVAISRSGSSVKLFVNGTEDGSTTNSADTSSTGVRIGSKQYTSSSIVDLSGFIDDLRITKGVARYTAAFTPPTAPFPDE